MTAFERLKAELDRYKKYQEEINHLYLMRMNKLGKKVADLQDKQDEINGEFANRIDSLESPRVDAYQHPWWKKLLRIN